MENGRERLLFCRHGGRARRVSTRCHSFQETVETVKPFHEWKSILRDHVPSGTVQWDEGRGALPTLKAGNVYLHSRYNPEQEAQRLIDSAELDPARPVLVVGLGLGYHVLVLLRRGFQVAVVEPDRDVAQFALAGPLAGEDVLLGLGDADAIAETQAFHAFAAKSPQVLVHPATARIHPVCAEAIPALLSKAALAGQHLNIAVVGPLYGGSLPITGYLVNAFRKLGHRTVHVGNDSAWDLYQTVTGSVEDSKASSQLGQMLTNCLSEWAYARVAECNPEICIVMAQAPVSPQFPERLAKLGIVTAFWYVENWRHLPYWRDIAPRYDYFFHIQPGEFERELDAIGCSHHAFVQTGCDPEVHRPVPLNCEERAAYACDLSFAGAGYYNRLQLFKGLTDYDFKIWGVDWPERELAKQVQGGEHRFDSDAFMKMVAGSKINLNLHSSTTHEGVDPKCDAINPRVFEIAAAGGFQLCDPCIGLEQLFDFESELPVYHDLKELRSRIDYYLVHPEEREAMAKRAQERALRDHTYEHRAQQMLDRILEGHGTRILKRGVRVQRTVGEMLERAGPDTPLGRWLATLPPEVLFTQEAITRLVRPGMAGITYPEKIFTYMKEVREFAEALLKERR